MINIRFKFFTTILFLISLYQFAYPQRADLNGLSLNHSLNYHPQKRLDKFNIRQVPETLYVYAIRVQFRPDTNPQTTGDGRFDLSNNFPDSVDAPPHDSSYFLNHLEFLKNYYFKASKGKLVINFQVLNSERNLPNFMADYSPGRNENLLKLGRLFFDTWRSADSVIDFGSIDPQKSAFVIFHAGVGRDVDLVSQGIFQGASDIPSIYLGINSLKTIYGDTTQGYHSNEGLIINHSAILPEQEFRVISTSFGSFFLELGMNGILAASIGSHLGLPDLFDTRTGRTAIGRFGLMDGQSIFSFLGVFPPEPSAWEKQYLGWVNSITIDSNGVYNTRAASIDGNGNSSVYKILISGKEYFLLENRNRDARKNGQTIYFIKNGIRDSIRFTSDQAGFENVDIWKLKGNITDVDELDWSLPGLKNDTADFQGGILIWHIDENVIDANISSNTINIDMNHRGVDLEEAKGAQDIGVVINTPFGQFVGDGTIVDYWFFGEHYVPSNIYRNEFTPTSFPNSKSYSNINSRVCVRNFSTIDSVMSFNFEICSGITNINTFPRFVGIDTSGNAQPIGFDYNGNGLDEIFINVNDTLYGFRDNGNAIRIDAPNGYLKDSASNFIVAYLPLNSSNKYIVGTYQNKFNLFYFNIDSNTTNPNVLQISTDTILTTPALILKDHITFDSTALYAGNGKGNVAKVKLNGFTIAYDPYGDKKIVELALDYYGTLPSGYIALDDDSLFLTSGYFPEGQPFEFSSSPVIFNKQNQLSLNNRIISSNLGITKVYSSPAVGDINKDGQQEIIFTADDKVFAVNRHGVLIDNFPFKATGVNKISSGCSVADLDGDGVFEVIFGTVDGRVYAYDVNGRVLDGFPLLTGKEIKSTPAIINTGGLFGLVVYSTDGYLYGWKTSWVYDSTKVIWGNFLTNKYHENFFYNRVTAPLAGPCLPEEKVYNWPNPVYTGKTNIRYFLNGTASSVKVKILDLSGELVTTLTGTANSGFDNEVPWDVSNVQSGIYIGIIELEGGSCSESVSIKIAVVK